jgi:hypothetical protein
VNALYFRESVKKHFDFMKRDYRYKLSFEDGKGYYRALFSCKKIRLEIWFETLSSELYLILKYANDFKVGLADALAFLGAPSDTFPARNVQVIKEEIMDKFVALFADVAKTYLKPLLTAINSALWQEVKVFADSRNLANRINMENGIWRNQAEVYWQNKDYASYIETCRKIDGELSAIEKKKLEYAKRHIE